MNDSSDIEDLTHDGAGVAKVEGYPLFIPGTLPGEDSRCPCVEDIEKIRIRKVTKYHESHRLPVLNLLVMYSRNVEAANCSIYLMKAS